MTAAGAVVAALAVVSGVALFDRSRNQALQTDLTAGSCSTDERSDPTGPPGRNHVAGPSYSVEPPAGGDHEPAAARSGVYLQVGVPADGMLVHSLEHGYVIVWHKPGLAEADVQALTQLQGRYSRDVLVVERPGLPVPVAATSWGRRLLCQQVEQQVLERFVSEYVGKGPEAVERG